MHNVLLLGVFDYTLRSTVPSASAPHYLCLKSENYQFKCTFLCHSLVSLYYEDNCTFYTIMSRVTLQYIYTYRHKNDLSFVVRLALWRGFIWRQ